MKKDHKSKEKLLKELKGLNKRIERLEKSEIRQKKVARQVSSLNYLKEQIIGTSSFNEKLKLITDGVVDIFDADFARIWMIKEADVCKKGCIHSKNHEKPDICNKLGICLHLMVSSGCYTHIDGSHRRVPFGCYKIGRVASSEYPSFITNDVTNDSQVHDHEWARNMGLTSFAGYRLLSKDGNPIGVLALFSKHQLDSEDEKMLEDLANTTSYVLIAGLSEESLIESEGKFRSLSEMSPAAIIVYRENRIIYTNNYTSQITGYTTEELQKMNFWDIFHPEFIKIVKERGFARQRGEKVPNRYEIKYIKKSGETCWADLSASRIIYEGNPAGMAILTDVTNRKEAEKALKESENLYRTIFDNKGAATIIIGPDTTILLANHGWEKLTGIPKEEQENKTSWTVYIHEDDVERMKAFHYSRRNDPLLAPTIYECRVADAKKRIHNCIVHVDMIPGTLNSVASLIDITALKKAEKALSESEKKYRDLIELLPLMVYETNEDGKITFANQIAFESFGYTQEDFDEGLDILQVLVPEDRERVKEILQGGRSGEKLVGMEFTALKKDGHTFPIVSYSDVILRDDKQVGIRGVIIDITEYKNAQNALKKSEERYKALYEDNPSMYFTVDAEGLVLSVNQYGCEQLGYTPMELINQSILKLFYEDDKKAALSGIKRCVSNLGELFHWELRKVHKDGTMLWVKDSARALKKADGNIVIFIVSEDITEHKQAEDQLKSSLEEKDVLLREIHHRVKNNMQIISSLLSLQSTYVKDIKDKELFEESRNRVRAMAIIHEKVYQSEDLSNIDFASYIPKIVYAILNSYKIDHRIDVKVNVDNVFLNIETAIPCGLVVNEILTNSIKHAFPNDKYGKIAIKLYADESGEITLIICDDGVGFPDDIDFENTESLGLRLVDVLINQLGGTVNVDSSHGTEFKIVFREFKAGNSTD